MQERIGIIKNRGTYSSSSISIPRLNAFYGILLIIFAIFVIRVFYLQVIQHDFYRTSAHSGQFKEYEIPSERGIIEAHDGDSLVPIVLNEDVFTVFADPLYIEDAESASVKLAGIIGGDPKEYEELMKLDSRYSILAKKLPVDKAEKVDNLELKGLGTRAVSQRVYPQGSLAGQILGFVDDEGNGQYGVEQFLDDRLKGQPGQLRAITDAQGVPLVANKDNVVTEPKNGERVALTIDISMQKRLEDLLKNHLKEVRSKEGSVVIIDPNNGEVKAMGQISRRTIRQSSLRVEDPKVFTNSVVSEPFEPGSVMKTLTVGSWVRCRCV